jgi:ribonuclease HI
MKISEKHQKEIETLMPPKERQSFLDSALETALKSRRGSDGKIFEVYVDGASRGNPGPAGGGFAVYLNGEEILTGHEHFGHKTNNQAEYLALRAALRTLYEHFPSAILHIHMDSKLAVEQLNGNYKVKSENVKPLFEEVRRILTQFPGFTATHVPRERNKRADELANRGIDEGGK